MYVRTINGKIWIITSQKAISGHRKDIIKASHNIIDLIEVGDYVKYNNQTSFYKVCDFLNEKVIVYGKSFGDWVYINSDDVDIKSIVTKEKFSQMEYKVGQ